MTISKTGSFLFVLLISVLSFAEQDTNSNQIMLCKSDGYESIPIESVKKIDVFLYELGKLEYQAEYTGDSIVQVLAPLNLNAPTRAGFVSAMLTGKVVLQFQVNADAPAQIRTFDIGNNRVAYDEQCGDVLYFPSRLLDRSWLP